MVVVDTNVLLDVVNSNPIWLNWSASQMSALSKVPELVINPMIAAELSIAFRTVAEVN